MMNLSLFTITTRSRSYLHSYIGKFRLCQRLFITTTQFGIVGQTGLEPVTSWLWVSCSNLYWATGPKNPHLAVGASTYFFTSPVLADASCTTKFNLTWKSFVGLPGLEPRTFRVSDGSSNQIELKAQKWQKEYRFVTFQWDQILPVICSLTASTVLMSSYWSSITT